MSLYVLVPIQYTHGTTNYLDSVSITPVGAYGSVVTGFEIYNAFNSPRTDYTNIYGFAQQPIIYQNAIGASFTLPSFLDASATAIYMRWEPAVCDPLGAGVTTNYIIFYTGASTGTVVERVCTAVYGDGSLKSDWIGLDGANGTVTPYADVIGIYDDNYNDKIFKIELTNDEADIATYGDEWKLYELMLGYWLALPDGYIREELTGEYSTFGGKLTRRPHGQPLWSGLYGQKKEGKELVFEGLRQSDRDNLVSMFAYSRGVFPLLLVERTAEKDTWKKVIMTGCEETEDGGYFGLTIGFVEE